MLQDCQNVPLNCLAANKDCYLDSLFQVAAGSRLFRKTHAAGARAGADHPWELVQHFLGLVQKFTLQSFAHHDGFAKI